MILPSDEALHVEAVWMRREHEQDIRNRNRLLAWQKKIALWHFMRHIGMSAGDLQSFFE